MRRIPAKHRDEDPAAVVVDDVLPNMEQAQLLDLLQHALFELAARSTRLELVGRNVSFLCSPHALLVTLGLLCCEFLGVLWVLGGPLLALLASERSVIAKKKRVRETAPTSWKVRQRLLELQLRLDC